MFDQKCASYSGDIVSEGFAGSAGSFLSRILRSCACFQTARLVAKFPSLAKNLSLNYLNVNPRAYPHMYISGLANKHFVSYLNVNPTPTQTCAFQFLPTDTVWSAST